MSDKDDKKTRVITMTLPTVLVTAIEAEMEPMLMPAGECIKHWLVEAAKNPNGVTIRLDIPKPTAAKDNQPELPLDGPPQS